MGKSLQQIQEKQLTQSEQLLYNRIVTLEKVLIKCLGNLKAWEEATKRGLNPHQHNTCVTTKKIIIEVEKVLNEL